MGQEYSSTSQGAELAEMRKKAVFTAQQVQVVKERFELLCDEDESVDRDLFANILKVGTSEANELFDFFDSDQSGRVDYYEFICAITLLSNSTIDEKAEIIFDVYDLDGSQRISAEELILLMKSVLTSLNHMSKKPAPPANKMEEKAKKIFDRWDTDQDNSISITEFKSIISKDPDILRLLISYNLMCKEELRTDFGGKNDDVPEVDSDLENEIGHADADDDERAEKIKLGIEYKPKEKDPNALYEEEEIGAGDEFMAVKPWLGTVKHSVPTGYAPKKGESDSPEASLELEYVHGYRCHDARNNLRYAPDGQAVYHTAAVGVVLNGKDNTQKFFIEHTDDITCLDMCGNLVATGQIGAKPLVCVWDCTTRQTKTIFQGDLQKSIALVCFSNDGKRLAAIANDDDHTIGIFNLEKLLNPSYDIRKAKAEGAIMIGKGPKAAVLDAKFDPGNTTLIISCVKEVNFASFDNGVIKCTKGSGWGNNPLQAVLCIGFIDQTIVTGTFNGSLFVWKGKSLSNTVQAHQGAVNAIWTRKTQKGIITGGNDGFIYVWDLALKKTQTIDMKQANISSFNPKVRSICENEKGALLVGLRGGEIVEMVNNQPKVLMRGHFDDELWGLCVHPNKNSYITAGEDMLLASWDVATRKQKKALKLNFKAKVLAYSPDEKFLAVGCVNGFVLILDPNTFAVVQTLKDRLKEISEIKFSPNSELLAVGAHDSEIFIYNVKKGFKIQAKLRGHHSTITHFDFSQDSSVLQSNCTSYEILYFDTKTGKRNPSGASANRNETWATWTCVLGWPVQGIWPEYSDGSDINALDRHPQGNVLATADDFSKVKLFKYPCPVERSSFVKVVGHSSHVTNVRFTADGTYLISTGGNDKSIFQWKYQFDNGADEQADAINQSFVDEEEQVEKTKDPNALFVEEEIDQGDEALAVKPFKGEVDRSKPTGFVMPKNAGTAPDGNLSLRYCHGYRCFDAKNAAKYCSNPEKIVFISAALGIGMDIKSKDQTFFQMHEEDVICLAVHPSGKYAATGQMAQKGKAKRIDMFVWEIESKTMLSRMNDFHLRAVCLVEFSPDGSKLASIGRDDDNSLAVYDWAKGLLLTTVKVDKAKVTAISYKNENEFMTCGLKHVKFYTANGKNIKAQRGTLDTSQQNEAFLCGVYAFNGVAVCGTQTGNLIPFNGTAASKSVQAHAGGVGTLCAVKNALISGGNDGKVLVWSWSGGKLAKTVEFCNMTTLSKFVPGIVSLDARPDGNTLLVGTRGGEIYEVNKTGKGELLLQGHYDGELWGCAVCPNALKYVTCGGDKTIRIWDAKKPWMLASTKPLENDVRAVDWSPNGKFIVAGDWKGKIMILDPKDLSIKDALQSSFTKQHQWLEDIKVSPDNTLVAFGAHGGPSPVEVMSIKNDSKLSKMYTINAGLTSALLHLDWSTDSSHVVVNSQAYELKFVNIAAKKNTAASGARDFEWASWTCKLGFPVQGVFQSVDYTDVNSVCRSNSKKILASGDDNSKVNLFKYPCVVERAQCKSYIGHSSHVTRVKFSYDDTRLISTGGNDKAILIWRTDFGAGAEVADDAEENTPDFDDDPNEYVEKKQTKRDKYGRPIAGAEEEEEDEDPNALFKAEKIGGGDEFLAVKPWLGAIKEPTGWKNTSVYQNQAPKVDLTLEYVHGYRAKDCRNNVRYLKSGKVVYHAAALGIVLHTEKNTQKFFNLHTDDITSMDVHPNGVFVATGEIGAKPSIYVWDSNSMQTIWHFKGSAAALEKGIANLTFSPSGNRLAAVAVDDNHKIGVYDTEVGTILAVDKGDTARIVDLKFKSESEFVSVGPKHFKHWTFQNKQMTSKKGQFGNANNVLRCVAWNDNTCLTGAADGNLHTWNGNALGKSYPLHKNGLDAIYVSPQYLITGGGDGAIVVSDKKTYASLLKVQLDTIIKTSFSTKLRSACFSADHKTILIGTYGSEIYELAVKDSKIGTSTKLSVSKELVKGHYTPNQKWTNEVWGLAVFSDNERYCTCSDDATLRIWSATDRKQLASARLDRDLNGNEIPKDQTTKDLDDSAKGRSIDISPDDKLIAVGCKDGTFRVFEAETLKQIHIIKAAKEWIQELKFSPDGSTLAVGSHDNAIYLYTLPNFQKKFTMRKHSSFITHLDWSEDSSSLHSNCGAYELLFWNATTGKQIPGGATAFRDERWATWTCVLGWPVQGIWPPFTSGDDINYVCRSSSKPTGEYEILASGDDFGKVRLLRYPSLQKGSESVQGVGHSSHVTCVKFSPNDNLLVSTGGEDNCVFQWRVTPTV